MASTALFGLLLTAANAYFGDQSLSTAIERATVQFSSKADELSQDFYHFAQNANQTMEAIRAAEQYLAYRNKEWDVFLTQRSPELKIPSEIQVVADFTVANDPNPFRVSNPVPFLTSSYIDVSDNSKFLKIGDLRSELCSRLRLSNCKAVTLLGATIEFEQAGMPYKIDVRYAGPD